MVDRNKGFTLIELLVVVAIIGILATIVITSLSKARKVTLDTKTRTEVESIKKAIELYHLDHGHYPLIDAEDENGMNYVAICQIPGTIGFDDLQAELEDYIDIEALPQERCIWYRGHYDANASMCDTLEPFVDGQGYIIVYNTKEKQFSEHYYGSYYDGVYDGYYHCTTNEG